MKSGVENKHNTFRMMLWLVVYYEFYEKKVGPFSDIEKIVIDSSL
jgi:hypothetical protein